MRFKGLTRLSVSFSTLCLILSLGAPAFCAGPEYWTSTAAKSTRKFLRGVGNVAFSFVEIPLSIGDDVVMTDPFTGTFTGLAKGVGRTVERVGVGVFEIVTFPWSHNQDFRPLIDPEFVMMKGTRQGVRDWTEEWNRCSDSIADYLIFGEKLEHERD